MDFKRSLSSQEYNSWLGLLDSLRDIKLTDNKADTVMLMLERKKIFTSKSLYRFLTNGGVTSRIAGHVWRSKLPLKIKVFLWQVFNNKLQVGSSLKKRGWKGSPKCCLCECLELIEHLFFDCHLATFTWGVIKEVFDLDATPRSLNDLITTWLSGKGPLPIRIAMFVFAGFAWALWTTRNKMAIEKQFPKAPTDIIYTGLSLLQSWSIKLKEEDKARVAKITEAILCWLKNFKPNPVLMSDVVEL